MYDVLNNHRPKSFLSPVPPGTQDHYNPYLRREIPMPWCMGLECLRITLDVLRNTDTCFRYFSWGGKAPLRLGSEKEMLSLYFHIIPRGKRWFLYLPHSRTFYRTEGSNRVLLKTPGWTSMNLCWAGSNTEFSSKTRLAALYFCV